MRVFLAQPIADIPVLPFLPGKHADRLFQNVPIESYKDLVTIVDNENSAEYILMPHEHAHVRNKPEYLEGLHTQYTKPIAVFSFGDSTKEVADVRFRVLRTSAYKSTLRSNEVVIPPIVEDLGAHYGSEPLPMSGKPRIGFVGFAGFPNAKAYGKYLIRNYVLTHGAQRQGLYFRRNAMSALQSDPRFVTDFIERTSFSGIQKTISLDPAQARKEYIENIKRNHFTLCPRGDGNFSLRFYEVLSLGRIPILIDTDVELPLEDFVVYEKCVVRVPWNDIRHTGDYVQKWIDTHCQDGFEVATNNARNTFIEKLFFPAFLKYALQTLILK